MKLILIITILTIAKSKKTMIGIDSPNFPRRKVAISQENSGEGFVFGL